MSRVSIPQLNENGCKCSAVSTLSVLYLTSKKGWAVNIFSNRMHFRLHKHLYFTATVNEKNSAFLDGHIVLSPDFAGFVSTCPVDTTLWHRRFGHLNMADVKQMIKQEMVEGITIQSDSLPDPICEPCLAGKQHRGPIPKLATHRPHSPCNSSIQMSMSSQSKTELDTSTGLHSLMTTVASGLSSSSLTSLVSFKHSRSSKHS